MGISKTLRKIFKTRKKRDDDEGGGNPYGNQGGNHPANQNSNYSNHMKGNHFDRGRSMRGGIYEPYRQHFPLKSQMNDYGMNSYGQPTIPGFNDSQQKPTFGPKLITGGDQGSEQNYSYHQPQQNQNQRPMSVYETRQIQPKLNRANSDASLSSYRPYQMYQTGQNRFGSQMNLQQSAYETQSVGGRRVGRTASMNGLGSYEQFNPVGAQSRPGLTRQGSMSNIQTASNYTNVYQRPRRPNSALGPARSMSDAASFAGLARPGRPSSAQGSCLTLDHQMDREGVMSGVMSPMSEYSASVNSSFVAPSQRVMSPVGSTYGSVMSPAMSSTTSFDLGLQQQNSFALHQLRSSQANLQQALRVQEDISRQSGNVKPAELDATMKIMQTCLDMLDSISGLVERSSTPQPTQMGQFNPVQAPMPNRQFFDQEQPKKSFINHQMGMKPIKSALKRPIPTTTSAFNKIQKEQEEMKESSPGLSDSSEGFYGSGSHDESTSGIESPHPIPSHSPSQNSPGPSVLSEDSGYGLPIHPNSADSPKIATFDEKTEKSTDSNASQQTNNSMKPMLSSLAQLQISSA